MSVDSDMSEDRVKVEKEEDDDECIMITDETQKVNLGSDETQSLKSPSAQQPGSAASHVSVSSSPESSQRGINEQVMRDNYRQSLMVRQQQQDIIQQRLFQQHQLQQQQQQQQQQSPQYPSSASRSEAQQSGQRRMPKRLLLDQSNRVVMSARTAPMQGQFVLSDPRQQAQQQHHQRGPDQPYRIRRVSRPTPYEATGNGQPFSPALPTPHKAKFGPRPLTSHPHTSQSTEMRGHPMTLPSFGHLVRHPITPPTEQTEDGLGTLSRAARLKVMKEDYLKACADSFDALHGINA